MDQATLVTEDIQEGRRLVEALDMDQIPVVAALWFFFSDASAWRLIIASSKVDDLGPHAVYTAIQTTMRANNIHLPLDQITIKSPKDQLIGELRFFAGTEGTPYIGGTHYNRVTIGDVFIEEAYVYRAARIVGITGETKLTVVVFDKPTKTWLAYLAMATMKNGLFQDIRVTGREWHQTHGKYGINTHLPILIHWDVKDNKAYGDIDRLMIANGRLQRIESVAKNVLIDRSNMPNS